MGNLLPNLPEEIRAARIGTCYDPIRRRLMQEKIAIDPERVGANMIQMISGKAQLKLRADSSTAKNAQSTFFALDSSFKVGSWVSAGFSMEQSNSEASTNDALNCYCSYIYEGQALQLIDNGVKALFNCMTEEFQERFTELINSSDSTDFFSKYLNFINTFGYGCVTKLMLTSGSAFTMTAKYSSASMANKSKYSASLGVGTPWGGGSVASSFASEVQKTDSQAFLELKGESLPENAPTNSWCNELMKSLLTQGLGKLSTDPGLISSYSGSPPKAPEIPKGEPTKKDPPKGSGTDISKEVQEKLMKDDGFKGRWEEYLSAQKDAFEKIKPDAVTLELCNNRRRLLAIEHDLKISDPLPLPEADKLSLAWDLGGYIPYSYIVKPWTGLFAEQMRSLALPVSFTSIYIAKAYVYYLTQLQFASYMSLMSDADPYFSDNSNIVSDAAMFVGFCGELLKSINITVNDALKKYGKFMETDYEKVVAAFEGKINKVAQEKRFFSAETRRHFFENYKFLMDMAGGGVFVCMFDDGTVSYFTNTGIDIVSKKSVATMLKDALRVYQCLTPKGELRPIYYENGNAKPTYRITNGLKAERKFDECQRAYYAMSNNAGEMDIPDASDAANIVERRYYPANLNDMKDAVTVCGVPMIADVDFNSILDFANPDREIT